MGARGIRSQILSKQPQAPIRPRAACWSLTQVLPGSGMPFGEGRGRRHSPETEQSEAQEPRSRRWAQAVYSKRGVGVRPPAGAWGRSWGQGHTGRGARINSVLQGHRQQARVLRGRVQRPLCPHGASRGQHCIVTGLSLTWGRAGEAPPLCRAPLGKGCVKALAGPAT